MTATEMVVMNALIADFCWYNATDLEYLLVCTGRLLVLEGKLMPEGSWCSGLVLKGRWYQNGADAGKCSRCWNGAGVGMLLELEWCRSWNGANVGRVPMLVSQYWEDDY